MSPYAHHESAVQLGEALSDADRASADAAAQQLMADAAAIGLRDNAAVAVACIGPGTVGRPTVTAGAEQP